MDWDIIRKFADPQLDKTWQLKQIEEVRTYYLKISIIFDLQEPALYIRWSLDLTPQQQPQTGDLSVTHPSNNYILILILMVMQVLMLHVAHRAT